MIARANPSPNGNGNTDRPKEKQIPIVMTSETFGPRVAVRDILNGLIRNPDELYQKDKDGYERVYANPIVKSQLSDLFAPIIAADVEVSTGDGDADEVLTEIINGCPAIEEAKEQMLFAYVDGIRLVETIWGRRWINGTEYNVPIDFAVHNHQRFAFDEYGHLWMTKDDRLGRTGDRNNLPLLSHEDEKALFVPWGKMLVHRYRDGDGRYGYGCGEGLDLWRHVKAWDAVYSFFIDYGQSYGNPIKVIKLDPEYIREKVGHGEDIDTVVANEVAILEDLIGSDTYAMDNRNEIVLLSSDSVPASVFTDLMNKIEANIKLMITGELITTGEGSKGSYALARIAREKPVGRQRRLSKMLDRTLSNQLLQHVLMANRGIFGDIAHSGKVVSKIPAIEHAQRLEFMLMSPFPVLKSEFYKLAEITEPTPDQITTGDAVTPALVTGGSPISVGALSEIGRQGQGFNRIRNRVQASLDEIYA